MFPRAKCYVFGSSINGLGFRGADADIFADLGYSPYDYPNGEQQAAKITMQICKALRRENWISNVSIDHLSNESSSILAVT